MKRTAEAIIKMADTLAHVAHDIPGGREMIVSSLESLVHIAINEHEGAKLMMQENAIREDVQFVQHVLARSKKCG